MFTNSIPLSCSEEKSRLGVNVPNIFEKISGNAVLTLISNQGLKRNVAIDKFMKRLICAKYNKILSSLLRTFNLIFHFFKFRRVLGSAPYSTSIPFFCITMESDIKIIIIPKVFAICMHQLVKQCNSWCRNYMDSNFIRLSHSFIENHALNKCFSSACRKHIASHYIVTIGDFLFVFFQRVFLIIVGFDITLFPFLSMNATNIGFECGPKTLCIKIPELSVSIYEFA